MKMKLFTGLAAFMLLLGACSSDDDNLGNWIDDSASNAYPRGGAISFTADNVGYMGLGYNSSLEIEDISEKELAEYGEFVTDEGYLRDMWKFDGELWTQVASFPGTHRTEAVSFVVANNGNQYAYVGTGYTYDKDLNGRELDDFYKYDVNGDVWNETAIIYPGGKVRNAVAFEINDLGYVGTGERNNQVNKDFYSFDASTETFTSIGFRGDKREGATAFVLNDKAYLVSGLSNGEYLKDVWEYDPDRVGTDETAWLEMIDLDDSDFDFENVSRSDAVGFAINGYGYIATGYRSGSLRDCWEFTPANQQWHEKTDFEGSSRQDAVLFMIKNVAYIGLGNTGSTVYDDLWGFEPHADYESED